LNSSVEKQVLAAFEEIHNLNVLHGDVRPANILVAEDGNKVWIIDFEDGEIIADGDEEREYKVSNEMEAIREMLRDIRKGQSPGGCLPLPSGEIPAPRVSSVEVC
jgi:RIO-like serine/threonine protein kinase